jgi:hypothetical protein
LKAHSAYAAEKRLGADCGPKARLVAAERFTPPARFSAFFAGLVAHRAGSLAGRLAGRWTFAAAACAQCFAQAAFVDGFYVFFHNFYPPSI